MPDDQIELTQTKAYASHDFGNGVAFVKAPGQPEVTASETLVGISNESTLPRTIGMRLANSRTGVSHPVVLSAYRNNGCQQHAIHNAIACGISVLHVRYLASMNPDLPAGTWSGKVLLDARHGYNGEHFGRLEIDVRIDVAGEPSRDFAFESRNFATLVQLPSVYFTVPTQSIATGPTSGHSVSATNGFTMITVQARDAISGSSTSLKLRAQRDNGCGNIAMNNAMLCKGVGASRLKVWFDPSDNPSLQQSRYRAKFNVQARGWHDKTFNQTFPVDVDVDLLP